MGRKQETLRAQTREKDMMAIARQTLRAGNQIPGFCKAMPDDPITPCQKSYAI
jgi:hypothetical protein